MQHGGNGWGGVEGAILGDGGASDGSDAGLSRASVLCSVVPEERGRNKFKVVYVVLESQYQASLTAACTRINDKQEGVSIFGDAYGPMCGYAGTVLGRPSLVLSGGGGGKQLGAWHTSWGDWWGHAHG